MSNKLVKFAKFMKKKDEVEWPIGHFRVKGTYARPEGDFNSTSHEFDDVVLVDAHDYDSDTGFPEDEFDRIIQEKIADNLPSDHFDLDVEEILQID